MQKCKFILSRRNKISNASHSQTVKDFSVLSFSKVRPSIGPYTSFFISKYVEKSIEETKNAREMSHSNKKVLLKYAHIYNLTIILILIPNLKNLDILVVYSAIYIPAIFLFMKRF